MLLLIPFSFPLLICIGEVVVRAAIGEDADNFSRNTLEKSISLALKLGVSELAILVWLPSTLMLADEN